MAHAFILAIDQGTTSSRALVFNEAGDIVGLAQKEFTQYYPQSGWVEHDPNEIWESQLEVINQAVGTAGINLADVAGIGIANQRETTLVWDRNTGEPVYNAIVWQDTRTSDYCEKLKGDGWQDYVKETTGLVIDSYFSGSKLRWILNNVPGARDKAEKGDLLFGTVDTWLIWKLTGGKNHQTDFSNASRTMLFNIKDKQWDAKLLELLDIPKDVLPEARPSGGNFGAFSTGDTEIPITAVLGDQQAALFGQACFEPGTAKNTYGTGCFMLMNVGKEPASSQSGLLTTIAWGLGDEVYYALEGSVFVAGAAVQWLRDEMGLVATAADTEDIAQHLKDDHGVYFVPAFAGLGAPHWDQFARGSIFGLTRDTGKEHIVRATLESLAYQTKDVLTAMESDSGQKLQTLKVDGGAVANNFLMQFQADIMNAEVERPEVIESTAQGAAYMAGLVAGLWSQQDIASTKAVDRVFKPLMAEELRAKLYQGWRRAVKRASNWLLEQE